MFPHERSLVSKMKSRPFVLLGVNTDKTAAEVKQKNVKEKITWRSWFDGPRTISQQYKIQGYPSLFLIDGKGIIRKKWLGGPPEQELDAAIEGIVKDTEKSAPKQAASADEKPDEEKKPSDDKTASGGDKTAKADDSKSTAPIGFNVGNRAPEISGKDTTGKAFRLSEYRGKVVVIDFWGFW